MNLRRLMCASATSAVVAAACGASTEPVSTTTTTMAPVTVRRTVYARPIPNADARQRVTAARCGHELDCGNLGFERAWPSYNACVSGVGEAYRNALSGTGCARGVDPLALEDCLDAVRTQSCTLPSSARRAVVARCSASDLCL